MKQQIYEIGGLFEDVQLNEILEDGKTFVDCINKYSLEEITKKYTTLRESPGFNIKAFILDNFELPPHYADSYKSNRGESVENNIRMLWDVLTRSPGNEKSSLINLPFACIVPGGRFREMYYWDSYFTMLGLREHNRIDLIENMINNFAFLINTFGHIPNGNRSYFLSRSQPPFFALMIALLANIKNDDTVYSLYAKELETEYDYWQNGNQQIKPGASLNHLVNLKNGELLNRYFDSEPFPRQESYAEDIGIAKLSDQPVKQLFTHLRAGCESGWDFSSRWFADEKNIATIQAADIIPVDLNCLLYVLEKTLAKTRALSHQTNAAEEFEIKAARRKTAILKYCWNPEINFFCDFNFVTGQQNKIITAAGLFPLFVNIADKEQAAAVEAVVNDKLLKNGGIVTTNNHTGQQWDAPNGWAPLQWIAVIGLENYGYHSLAKEIANRWLMLNEKVFASTGKMMEKYNVEDLDKTAGGGEYPGQDGFGWTNGVYLALKKFVMPKPNYFNEVT